MKYYYRVTIAYKGTHYFGWQAQSENTLNEVRPTIQGTIQNVLKKISNYQPCSISGASRTDRGVHAQAQIAKITLPKYISINHLVLGLNSLLPKDIRILKCEPSIKEFQPQRNSLSKEYHYYFAATPVENVAISDIALNLPINALEPEDMDLLQNACQLFVGTHDFYNFSSRDKRVVTSVREIFYCNIHQTDFLPLADNILYLKIIGDGFLKYMVRYLMGALIKLLKRHITLEDITLYLQQHQKQKLSYKAHSRGLHLINIKWSK